MIDGAAAFDPLNDDEIGNSTKSPDPDQWTPITPIPTAVFPVEVKLGGREPKWTWIYRDTEKRPLGVACQWPTATGKDFRFATWCRHENGKEEWRLKHLVAPRPIYGLDRLAQRPLAPVLIVEGEKKCIPAEKLFPDHVAIAWPGGAESTHKVDWSPLKGRRVVVWPDNDDAGRKCAVKVAGFVLNAGADSALVVPVPHDFPIKWDLADRPPEGADLAALLAAARPMKVEPRYPAGFRMGDRGLVWHDPSDADKPEIVVSDKFEVLAESRDDAGWNWGVLLRWQDPDGRPREWAMPRSTLAGDGIDVRRALLDGGLYVGAGTKARNLLTTFLSCVHVEERAKAVSAIGWYGEAFVFPDGAIGKTNGERTILQTSTGVFEHSYNVKGTLTEWKEHVAKHAVGNSRLALVLSMAFASALVGPCGIEAGGIHLRGRSSIGKSTALAVAGSVWGGGDRQRYVMAWRATANGLEAVAAAHNDALLCLDELAQLSGKEAGEVAYMLANGVGKSRASRDATARKPARWRLLFLSSGEISLADKMREDRGRRQTAGQQVRVVDVSADTGSQFGLFEELHGFVDAGCFAKHLVAASQAYYGTASRAFIVEIAKDLDSARRAVAETVKSFIAEHCPADADGQVQRVAGRFGLIAAAGEIAAAIGILPWPTGEALIAAKTCFDAWVESRGGVESAEVRDGVEAVRAFLSAHSTSRFLAAWEDDADELRIANLAGFRKKFVVGESSAWEYFITPQAWAEATTGFDRKELAKTLVERGLLIPPESGLHQAQSLRVPGHGRQRLYHLHADILDQPDATLEQSDGA